MKSKRFWFRSILILGLSVGVLGSLIAASPAWISDWIFRTGQTVFSIYNSSTQLIETVDNRNKARRQYGALTVDGTLYANGAISATGAINIGADVSLTRSAADVLNTADSVIVQGTQTIYENIIIGNAAKKKIVFNNANNYRIINAANYSSVNTDYTGMIKITLPVLYSLPPYVDLRLRGSSYNIGDWEADITAFFYYAGSSILYIQSQIRGSCPFTTIQLGVESNHPVVILGTATTHFSIFSMTMDVMTKHYSAYAKNLAWMGEYTIATTTDLTGISPIVSVSAGSLPNINSNGLVVGTNKTSLTSGYVLDVSGAAYVSGTIYGAGNISGLSFTDRTPGSPEDAIKEIETWKVVGDQVDHASLGDCAVDIKELKTGFEVKDKSGNVFNSIEKKFIPAKGSKETDIQALSDMAEKIRDGIAEVSAGYQVKEVSAMVETKGRDISKTISTLSRAIQQLSERLDKLEGK